MPTVRTAMSSPVITISLHTRLPVVKHLMREHNIRRIPVVENDEIMGIITLGDVRNAFPSDASILNPFELSYLLEKVLARDIMRTQLFTIEADALLVDAARMMLEHRVSGLPVVEAGHLVGIITEADIFRAIVAGDVPLAASPYDLPLKAKTTI